MEQAQLRREKHFATRPLGNLSASFQGIGSNGRRKGSDVRLQPFRGRPLLRQYDFAN